MYWIFLLLFLLSASCSAIRQASDKIEETHHALYKQKVLFVCVVESRKVILTNPTYTRCYFLKGKQYAEKWAPGDTFIIENNLEDFYKLNYARKCE